jgi:MtN3 and saliva related transmembrane protein
MISPDIFAYAATVLNIVMQIPQVLSTWKTKQVRDLSLISLLIFMSASLLWGTYGVMKSAPPVILSNAVLFILNGTLVFMKLTFEKKKYD